MKEQEDLTAAFPPITHGPNSLQQMGTEEMGTIDELQQRIKELEEINEKLIQERLELDKEFGQ